MTDRSPPVLEAAAALEEPATPPRFPRVRAALLAPLHWLALLLVPDRAVPRRVRDGKYGAPMFLATVLAAVAALSIASRVDLRPQVLEPQGPPEQQAPSATEKPDAGMSDRELAEALEKARTVEQVKDGLGAAATPITIVMFALLLVAVTRFVGGAPSMRRAVTLASVAWMPDAVRAALATLAASHRPVIAMSQLPSLLLPPLHFPSKFLTAFCAGVDPFTAWSWVLIAVGMPALAGVSRKKAALTTVALFVLAHLLLVAATAAKASGAHP